MRLSPPHLAFLLALTTLGCAPTPTTTYNLHTSPPTHVPDPAYALTPNDALILLLPGTDATWTLKQITAWDTSTPSEQTLTLPAYPPSPDATLTSALAISPSGQSLVARIVSVSTHTDLLGRHTSEAAFAVVDLSAFTLLSHQTTTDPRLLASDLRFHANGLLLANGVGGFYPHPGRFPTPGTTVWSAVALTLPDLTPQTPCDYLVAYTSPASETETPTRLLTDLGNTCPALLKAAKVSNLEDLLNTPPTHPNLAPPNCTWGNESSDHKFALVTCGVIHNAGLFTYTTSKASTVISLPGGKPILSLPSPFWKQPPQAFLAAIHGHDYLLTLRDGIHLNAYRLP